MSAPPAPSEQPAATPGPPDVPPPALETIDPERDGDAPPPPSPTPDTPAEADVVAPADLAPPPVWWERLAWYGGTMFLALLLAVGGMQLWNRDLHAPFYYDLDALLYLPLVRTTIETGTHWRTERLGAPGRQELYDFPVIDYLHFAFLWAIGRVTSDLLLVYNIYSLLTYPLTALTAMWVLRWLRLSLPAAALGGLLYAFLPYHQERYHYHYFLAAYWWVPVSLVPALAICKGDFPFFSKTADGRYAAVSIRWAEVWATLRGAVRGAGAAWRAILGWSWCATRTAIRVLFTRRSLAYVALGLVTSAAGAYYAFFACAAYAFAGLYASAVFRTWRGAVSAALVIAPVVVGGIAGHMPKYVYEWRNGKNPITERLPHEADSYGLKIAHLLLPANDHNVTAFANLRQQYSSPDRPAEGERAGSLGLIGGAGLVALLGLAAIPARRRWPEGALAALTLALILLGSIGAFGSLFNLIVTPEIRGYNRICVLLGFLSLAMVLWWLDRFLLTRAGRYTRRLRYPALAALLAIGFFDQTPWGWNPFNPKGMAAIDAFAERFRADKRFFRQIEDAMPPGSKVFCLPYVPFPESPAVHKMPSYEHARGYVMTDTLFWSYGAIKGREADVWQKDVTDLIAREQTRRLMLERIVARGFDGLLIDGRGFAPARNVDRAAALIAELNSYYQADVGSAQAFLPKIIHEDGRQFFLDLRPFRDAWRVKEADKYARLEAHERDWVAPLWLQHFIVTDLNDEGERTVWGKPDGTLTLVNPADRTRTFVLDFNLGVETVGPFEFTLSGLVDHSFTIDRPKDEGDARRSSVHLSFPVTLPPGRSHVRIRCRPPVHFSSDSRNLSYFIKDFKLVER